MFFRLCTRAPSRRMLPLRERRRPSWALEGRLAAISGEFEADKGMAIGSERPDLGGRGREISLGAGLERHRRVEGNLIPELFYKPPQYPPFSTVTWNRRTLCNVKRRTIYLRPPE